MAFVSECSDRVMFVYWGSQHVELKYSSDDCGIMHDKTDCVNMSPLPSTLSVTVNQQHYLNACTATLSCSHTFHASALALHFLRNSQTCPLCRQGSSDTMQLEHFGKNVAAECLQAFESYLDNVESDSDNSDDDMTHVSNMTHLVNVDDSIFERDLKFCVEFKSVRNEMPHMHCNTPSVMSMNAMSEEEATYFCGHFGGDIVCTASSESFQNLQHAENWRKCWVQRWFKREVYRQLQLQTLHSATQMRVAIYHPLLGVKYFSEWSNNLRDMRSETDKTVNFVMNTSMTAADSKPLAVMRIESMNVTAYVNKETLRTLCIDTVQAILSRSNSLILGSYE